MIKYIITIISVFIALESYSQTVLDAVRYSEFMPLGTARTVGAGSSFGAMGGDFSVISINPAGLGSFYRSEFTVTPGVGFTTANATVGQNGSSTSATGFGIDNIGYVGSNYNPESTAKWITNFAIGLSKSKSLKRDFEYNNSSEGSITERWRQLADGFAPEDLDNFETGPAFDAGVLIEAGDNLYDTDYFLDDIVAKSQTVKQSGFINELNIAWAGNYNNKLNIGVSAAIPFVSLTEEKQYTEAVNVSENGSPVFNNSLVYNEYLNATGAGINLKAGAIYNLNPIRIGAAVHTPTWYSMDEDFDSDIVYQYEYFGADPSSGTGTGESLDGNFTYSFSSPWKFVGSLGSLLNFGAIKGFVNADVEYLDYSSASFDLTSNSTNFGDAEAERLLNQEVQTRLTSGMNIRLGTEIAYKKYRVRAGYALLASPYVSGESDNAISAGLGYRGDEFFLDFGYRLSNLSQQYTPYASADASRDLDVQVDASQSRVVATFGFMF